jgi:UDP-N-acetylglucosamine 2-epimerase (non-hydrolysing)
MKKKHKIIIVAGARPNFMKIAPIMRAFKRASEIDLMLVHSGQHYDYKMSEVFFSELGIPNPSIHLGVGKMSPTGQIAKTMILFEKILLQHKPELVIVVGDVNSTLACALTSKRLGVKVAHVEAGLRSFDSKMPEETNRRITDEVSDLLFVSERSGMINLKKEQHTGNKVFFVGNVMIDTLRHQLKKFKKNTNTLKVPYAIVTLHRPSNVDGKNELLEILEILELTAEQLDVIFPIHPRTVKMLKQSGLHKRFRAIKRLHTVDPLGYNDFVNMVRKSKLVLTDSGGIQEETTALGIPCLTMRENTERPVTITKGTNVLVGRDQSKIKQSINRILAGNWKKGQIPAKWDGQTAPRIVAIIRHELGTD